MAVIKKLYHFTPPKIKVVVKEEEASMKQGIVTILRSDRETPSKSPSSIRRTLSADMSSKKWLAQNGFSETPTAMKKNVSSQVLALQTPYNYSSSSSLSSYQRGDEQSNESNPSQDDVWRSIQSQKGVKESKPIWGSILTTEKDGDNKPCSIPLPAPYGPPLMKRSSSFLSEKSLEICTESLGSETGSDDSFLSSYPCSESSYDADDYKERENILTQEKFRDSNIYYNLHVAKYRNAPVRPIPPPIHSICTSGDSLHMQPRRENGRLVLEAVSVPPRNYFHAQRGDGRLVLTLIHHLKTNDRVSNENQIDEENNKEGGIEEEEDYECEVVKQELRSFLPPNKVISVHKSSLVMKTFLSPGNKNPSTWFSNKKVEMIEEDERDKIQITQSLPSPPPAPCTSRMILPKAQSSFDAYECLWRNNTTTVSKRGFINPVIANMKNMDHIKDNNNNDNMRVAKDYMNQDHLMVTMTMRGGKLESFVPYLKSCKEAKRSLLIWEPYCIATS